MRACIHVLIPLFRILNNHCTCRLLDVLADRKSKTALSGTVLLNGNKRPPNFKTLVGYVVQVRVILYMYSKVYVQRVKSVEVVYTEIPIMYPSTNSYMYV